MLGRYATRAPACNQRFEVHAALVPFEAGSPKAAAATKNEWVGHAGTVRPRVAAARQSGHKMFLGFLPNR
jgi:hypothetical protein